MPVDYMSPKAVRSKKKLDICSKVIDFFAPLQKGFKMGLLGGAGVGKTVLIKEIIHNDKNLPKELVNFAQIDNEEN